MRRLWAACAAGAIFALAHGCATITPGPAPVTVPVPVEPAPEELPAQAAARLALAQDLMARADRLRLERSVNPAMGAIFREPADAEAYDADIGRAVTLLESILADFPEGPEAPQTGYLLGVVYDFPFLNRFDEAYAHYRRTMERHPQSPFAAKARERAERLERLLGGVEGSPHAPPAR